MSRHGREIPKYKFQIPIPMKQIIPIGIWYLVLGFYEVQAEVMDYSRC
jgi:hypothetical protein